jgi:hypothetical protein
VTGIEGGTGTGIGTGTGTGTGTGIGIGTETRTGIARVGITVKEGTVLMITEAVILKGNYENLCRVVFATVLL